MAPSQGSHCARSHHHCICALFSLCRVHCVWYTGTFTPASAAGRILTIFMCFIGIGTFIGVLAQVSAAYSPRSKAAVGWIMDCLIENRACLDRVSERRKKPLRAVAAVVINFAVAIGLILIFSVIALGLADVESDEWQFSDCVYFAVRADAPAGPSHNARTHVRVTTPAHPLFSLPACRDPP